MLRCFVDTHKHVCTKFVVISRSLPLRGKIRLLDVGSCFNPFAEFDEFLSVGIDISPAVTVMGLLLIIIINYNLIRVFRFSKVSSLKEVLLHNLDSQEMWLFYD